VREGADVGPTNLGRVPLRVAALVVGAPWLRSRATARRWCWWLRARLRRRARQSDAATTLALTPSRVRRSGHAACNARERCARAQGSPRSVEAIGSQNESTAQHEQRLREQALRLESSLTNEVQRRAKRVRCNAGLGGSGLPARLVLSVVCLDVLIESLDLVFATLHGPGPCARACLRVAVSGVHEVLPTEFEMLLTVH